MPGQMVLRCGKTGRLFFSTEEATEHAEAFGAAYANFEEVSLDTKVWVCKETGRPAYTEEEMNRLKQRDPESKTWEEKTVMYLKEKQDMKDKAAERKHRFYDCVDQKKLTALVEAKGHGKNRAAKALHFTRERGTIEAAEKWITENASDPEIDKLSDEFLDSIFREVDAAERSADVAMADGDAPMEDASVKRKFTDGEFYFRADFRQKYIESKVKKKWTDGEFYDREDFKKKYVESKGEGATIDDADFSAVWTAVEVQEGSDAVDDAEFQAIWGSCEDDKPKAGDPNPPEIKALVTRSLVEQLMEMGYSELRSEKAIYKVDNASVEHAANWLVEHAEDADIDMPVPKPGSVKFVPQKPKLSKAEAEAKARELQEKLRAKRAAEEKLNEKEKERMRIESTKMMLEANEKLKEEERKRALEQQKREKEAHEKHRAELKEQLRQDYRERFGCDPPEEDESAQMNAIKEKTSKDQAAYWLNKLKTTYKDTDKDGLKVCLSTLKIMIKNLQENPQEAKFKKLKLDNKAVQNKILPYTGAVELLDVLGFEKKEDCLEQRKSVPDGWLCGNAIKFIELILGQIG
eukprot:TRINITY_DN8636_c0_g1_i1.p1 TRINITY_DN8636_c0_g1~~TRINITY_DN8636_c0_g1_i1.p1  ORF type:complete len:577 (-),score=232.67 TRINITY_DN8636_c0_g1_i1:151-1881(-)